MCGATISLSPTYWWDHSVQRHGLMLSEMSVDIWENVEASCPYVWYLAFDPKWCKRSRWGQRIRSLWNKCHATPKPGCCLLGQWGKQQGSWHLLCFRKAKGALQLLRMKTLLHILHPTPRVLHLQLFFFLESKSSPPGVWLSSFLQLSQFNLCYMWAWPWLEVLCVSSVLKSFQGHT